MAEHEFTVYTEPHKAKLGDITYLFQPEPETADILDRMATLARELTDNQARHKIDTTVDGSEGDVPAGRLPIEVQAAGAKEATRILREFLRGLMMPESVDTFDNQQYPDRVLQDMQNWLLGVYGLRPTTSSSDSSASSPATTSTGDDSTGSSPSAE